MKELVRQEILSDLKENRKQDQKIRQEQINTGL